MSYRIYYRSQFVKTSRGFIPMVESGSSNCTQYNHNGREVRERDWHDIRLLDGVDFYTEDELLRGVDDWKSECDAKVADYKLSDNAWNRENAERLSFGWYMGVAVRGKSTSSTTFAMIRNLITNGIKQAIPYKMAVRKLGLSIYYYERRDSEDKYGIFHRLSPVESEDEFFAEYDKIKSNPDVIRIGFLFNDYMADEYMPYLLAERGMRRKSSKFRPMYVRVDDSMYLGYGDDGLLRLTPNKEDAHIFTNFRCHNVNLQMLVFMKFQGTKVVKCERA